MTDSYTTLNPGTGGSLVDEEAITFTNGIATFTVTAGGSGYQVGDVLTVGTGTAGTLTVASLSGSAVATATILSAGWGYGTGVAYATTDSPANGTGCTITVNTVLPTIRRRSRVEIAGALQSQVATVENTTPAGTEYALVTRNIPSGTQTVQTTDLLGNTVPVATDETVILLRRMLKIMEAQAAIDVLTQRQRVLVEQATAANLNVTIGGGTIAAITTVSTVSSATIAAGGVFPVNQEYEIMDRANNTFANAIRRNLVWS